MGLARKLNKLSREQSGGSKYGIERREISTEAEKADVRPKEATQRQQRLCRANMACVIHTKAAGVTQRDVEAEQSLRGLL